MTITIEIMPEVETGLLTQANARGMSLTAFVSEIVAREAHVVVEETDSPRTGQLLVDVCGEIRGLLTNDEIDTLFDRNRSLSRPVEL